MPNHSQELRTKATLCRDNEIITDGQLRDTILCAVECDYVIENSLNCLRFGSKADIEASWRNVRFTPQKWTLARLLDHLVRERHEGAVLSHAHALGRLDTVSCQRVKWANSGAILISARRPPISIATNAVMSAIVKRSPATNLCPF